ncbi:MAG: ABC transporter ATP-binding protein [Fibrobacteria bacterium]|nr:ABC transporter ATP-binding protein [Fibrobacteria bacterium]
MSHHLVIAENLSYSYPDGTRALDDVSFEIHHGESVGLIGPNGAGKSTLINHLNGYLLPTSGQARIGDIVINKKTRQDIRKTVGVVFQNPDDQLFMSRIYEDVAFGPENLGLPPQVIEDRVKAALSLLNMWPLRDKAPHHLSDGQKRAAAIATVLSMDPDVLVMDEPSSNLDPKSRRKIINFLNEFEHTKIIVSHDLDLIWDCCKRTILLKDGKVEADGPTEEILKNKELLEGCNLELPFRFQGDGF